MTRILGVPLRRGGSKSDRTFFAEPAGAADPAFLVQNTFEGGVHGTVVSVANSGGASGSAFDVVSSDPVHGPLYDNTRAAHGTLSAKMRSSTDLEWTSIGSRAEVWARTYVWLPATDYLGFTPFISTGGATAYAEFDVMAVDDKLSLWDFDFTPQYSLNPIPRGEWIRLEFRIKAHATQGLIEAKIFQLDSLVPLEVVTKNPANTSDGTPFSTFYCGGFGGSEALAYWSLDDFAVGVEGYLGPV